MPPGTWFHLARVVFSPKRLSRLHSHDFPEIFWIESGEAWHEINGTLEKLSPGDIIFIRSSDHHRFRTVNADGFIMVNLAFPAPLLKDLQRRHEEIAALYTAAPFPAHRRLASPRRRELAEEMRRLAHSPGSRMAIERSLLEIYLSVTEAAAPAAPLPDWLARACLALERPENFIPGVPAFVRLCGRSPEYVSRSCRNLLGQSPTELVNTIRLNHAARELRLGTRSILEIALESGFGNLAHFYELFHKAHGTTPRRYRLEHQRTVS